MTQDVTQLLRDCGEGRREALDALLPIVYDELRRVARNLLRGEHAETLPTTALVHEAYLKLVGQRSVDWQSRVQFFGLAAQAMRRILVDHARERRAAKREGIRIALDDAEESAAAAVALDESLVDLDVALGELADLDPRQARIVELRFFGGLTFDEVAAVLDMSRAAVFREWTFARAWLYAKING